MKKLLILSLVFVLVPAASATISFVTTDVTLYGGESCTGQIASDQETGWSGYLGNPDERISDVWSTDPDCCQAEYVGSGYWRLWCYDVVPPEPCSFPPSGVQYEFIVYTLVGDAGGVFYIYLYDMSWTGPLS